MTGHEKKMNKKDLHDFKSNEPYVQAMIPGIHNLNSVGTSPLKRGNNLEKHDQIQKKLIKDHNASLPQL